MFEGIIWDFDGTLFNTYPGMVDAFKKALKDNGVEAGEDEILKYMKVSVGTAVDHFIEMYPSLNDGLAERFSFHKKYIDVDKVFPFPYAREVCFDFKKKGGRNFILTHRGGSTFEFLKFHGMIDCFDEIGTKHNCFKRKPDPEGFVYFTEKYGLDNDKMLAIGDRDCDILGAKKAGIKTCLYNTNSIEINEKPDFIIESLSELYNIL